MAIVARREVLAPIVTVREELTHVVWEKKPELIPRAVSERWLGLTQGTISHKAFSLGYQFEWNQVSVELWGRLASTSPESTMVSYTCGIYMGGQKFSFAVWFGIAVLVFADLPGMSVLMILLGAGQFAWIARRNRLISMQSDATARYLVERIEHALAQAEQRHAALVGAG